MSNAHDRFASIPGRLLMDTCVLNLLQDEGAYVFEGELPPGCTEADVTPDLQALRWIFQVNQRASFQFFVSPITFAELANETDMLLSQRRISWALDVLDVWLTMLEETGDRKAEGGTVRHRFKLPPDLQQFETRLMQIPDFRRDPLDRLLMLQYKMGNCDAFLTVDRGTILRHRESLATEGTRVLTPSEFWQILKPYAALWY